MIRNMIPLLVVAVIAMVSGCIQESSVEMPAPDDAPVINGSEPPHEEFISALLDIPFLLPINQTAMIESENLSLTFLRVVQDSRCPYDVDCFWRGGAVIELAVIKDTQNIGNVNLSEYSDGEMRDESESTRYRITLNYLHPYIEKGDQIANVTAYFESFPVYTANLTVSRLSTTPSEPPPSPTCVQDSDCKLLYSSCDCIAVPIDDPRAVLDDDDLLFCEVNNCAQNGIEALCREQKCVRSDAI